MRFVRTWIPNVIGLPRGIVLNLTPEGVLRLGADSGAIAQMRPVAFKTKTGQPPGQMRVSLKNGQEAVFVWGYDSSRPLFRSILSSISVLFGRAWLLFH